MVFVQVSLYRRTGATRCAQCLMVYGKRGITLPNHIVGDRRQSFGNAPFARDNADVHVNFDQCSKAGIDQVQRTYYYATPCQCVCHSARGNLHGALAVPNLNHQGNRGRDGHSRGPGRQGRQGLHSNRGAAQRTQEQGQYRNVPPPAHRIEAGQSQLSHR